MTSRILLHPQSIEDLTAIVSLYRPGPMDNIPQFIANKHNPGAVTYKHPLLEPILSVTYGVIVYQEDTDGTAAQLDTVDHDIVVLTAHLLGLGLEQRDILGHRSREGMM